jgi:hypothetical protein
LPRDQKPGGKLLFVDFGHFLSRALFQEQSYSKRILK